MLGGEEREGGRASDRGRNNERERGERGTSRQGQREERLSEGESGREKRGFAFEEE